MNIKPTSPLSSPGLPGEVSRSDGGGLPSPIPQPKPEPTQDHLPAALTFFLTRQQRTQILRALKQLNPNRTAALINALNIK
ncbi:MAG: hypothetical protein ACSHX5_08490 [Phycisphaerales bacterium]